MNDPHDTRVIAGRNPVREALADAQVGVEKVLLQQGMTARTAAELRSAAKSAGVPVQVVPQARLNKLAAGAVHQGVVALAAPITYLDLDAMLAEVAPDRDAVGERKPILVVLDEISDPHNFGAIVRSAVAAGAAGLIVPSRRMAPMSAVAVKASAGTALRARIARVDNLGNALQNLKERGYWVAGAAGEGETTAWEMDWDRPLVIVIGSEDSGLRPSIAAACDFRVSIPMAGPAESLNASVAAGILLFAAARGRS